MSKSVGPKRPPVGTRFRKGQSGNPKGRPRAHPPEPPSAFDIIMDRTLTVTQKGVSRDVTVDEALQHATYQAAIAGNRSARGDVLKMIVKREKWLAAHQPKHRHFVERWVEEDPDNANEALLLLGIAERDLSWNVPEDRYERLLLKPWAVQLALSRPGRPRLSDKDIAEVKRCTREPESLRWPRKRGE